ncbi:MAG: sensor histidine kinase [Halobacteriales archaeon]
MADLFGECWRRVRTGSATIDSRTSHSVLADRGHLRRLLENLVRNADEHGDDATVTVADLDDGFCVADDGPGVQPDDRDRIFDAGFSTSATGTGFGLRVVERIAKAHGWSVCVTDSDAGAPGSGSPAATWWRTDGREPYRRDSGAPAAPVRAGATGGRGVGSIPTLPTWGEPVTWSPGTATSSGATQASPW